MNHRIVALAEASENHSVATSDTNINKKMEIQKGRVTCPDIFISTQILLELPKVRPGTAQHGTLFPILQLARSLMK